MRAKEAKLLANDGVQYYFRRLPLKGQKFKQLHLTEKALYQELCQNRWGDRVRLELKNRLHLLSQKTGKNVTLWCVPKNTQYFGILVVIFYQGR